MRYHLVLAWLHNDLISLPAVIVVLLQVKCYGVGFAGIRMEPGAALKGKCCLLLERCLYNAGELAQQVRTCESTHDCSSCCSNDADNVLGCDDSSVDCN